MSKTSTPEFVVTRLFAAPRDLIFQTWTEVEHLAKWLAPEGCGVAYLRADIRPQGSAHYCMTTPDGLKMYGLVQYRDIKPSDLLVYVQSFADAAGQPSRHPGAPTWPLEMVTTIHFKAVGKKTEITLTWVPLNASEAEIETFRQGMDGMAQGWDGTFKALDGYLAKTSI